MELLFLIWLAVYLSTIIKRIIPWMQAANCAMKLDSFIRAFINCDTKSDKNRERYQKELDELLRYYPVISSFFIFPNLSYGDSALNTCSKAKTLLDKFQMEINYRRHSLIRSLNPFISVKKIVLFPATAIHWMGFKPGRIASLIINAVGWLITYLLSLYSSEVKELLSLLFHQLIEA